MFRMRYIDTLFFLRDVPDPWHRIARLAPRSDDLSVRIPWTTLHFGMPWVPDQRDDDQQRDKRPGSQRRTCIGRPRRERPLPTQSSDSHALYVKRASFADAPDVGTNLRGSASVQPYAGSSGMPQVTNRSEKPGRPSGSTDAGASKHQPATAADGTVDLLFQIPSRSIQRNRRS